MLQALPGESPTKEELMISISLCMIVKNEEAVLSRCLDSIADLMDEIIIVDTGSTDKTKEIALKYTDKVYDFEWTGSFSDARNYSFSFATKEYIYCADADEYMDEENRNKFLMLKRGMLRDIDIVQMYYSNQLSYNTIYNYDKELRPKLYKRLRPFVWENAIHEAVRLDPLIYESDITIEHRPTSNHKGRDLAAFEQLYKDGVHLNKRLHNLYAKELMISGEPQDFTHAYPAFAASMNDEDRSMDEILESCCICAKACFYLRKYLDFFKYTTRAISAGGCSEICCALGDYYRINGDHSEASIWYYNAAYETEAILNAKCHTSIPLGALAECFDTLGDKAEAARYRQMAIDSEKEKE